MKNILCMAMGLAAISITTGCATTYRVSEQPMDGAMVPQRKAEAVTRKRVASVKVTASDAAATRLASSMVSPIEASLVTKGFDVSASLPADTAVSVAVTRSEKARLDDWRVYEGTADVRVEDAGTAKLVGTQTFSATGERSRDEAAAEKGVKDSLVAQIGAWLEKTADAAQVAVPLPPPDGKAVTLLVFTPADGSAGNGEVLAAQRRFMEAVAGHSGIVSCRLEKNIPATRSYVFRVEFEPAAFPGGLVNTLVLDIQDLGGNSKLECAW